MGAGDREFNVISWGWRGNHRIWRTRWQERPGMRAEVTGPSDAIDALVKAWQVRDRLPWEIDRD